MWTDLHTPLKLEAPRFHSRAKSLIVYCVKDAALHIKKKQFPRLFISWFHVRQAVVTDKTRDLSTFLPLVSEFIIFIPSSASLRRRQSAQCSSKTYPLPAINNLNGSCCFSCTFFFFRNCTIISTYPPHRQHWLWEAASEIKIMNKT